MLQTKIEYLNSIIQRLRDEELLGNTALRQWEVMVGLVESTQSLNLDKSSLLTETEETLGAVSPENFRKRMSMLNHEFEASDLGIKIDNTKTNVNIVIDDQQLNNNLNKQTAEFIKESNAHNELDNNKLVPPKASPKPIQAKRQVLFSYAWGTSKEELDAQRLFADMLEQGLNNPPAQYQDQPKVSLFIDYKGFEAGESQREQQDAMCEETPIAVVCYTHKYLNSDACRREIGYYLTEEGHNLPNRRALVVPFDCGYGEMDTRFKENLALTTPAEFINGLDFFTSANIAVRKAFINQLVNNIYSWFNKYPNPPKYDKYHSVKHTLQVTGNNLDLSTQSPEYLKGNTQQHQYDGAINIIDHMYQWATSTANDETRLFYLLGDFGAGKSTSCQMLTKRLMENYNDESAKDKNGKNKPVLPIYLDLKKLLNSFSDQQSIPTQPISKLIDKMLDISGVTQQVSGNNIVQFINEYPCLLIFDGFDEVGQKLNTQQQTGLLNKLLEIFPKRLYEQDLNRLADDTESTQSNVPINSRILISCRTHFFKTHAEQEAFQHLYYRHEAEVSAGEIKNYQIYYLLPFTKEQIENYLTKWLGESDAKKALSFINNVHDLSGLSERPLMLNLIRDLLPELQKEFAINPHINASTLYKLLFDKVGYRDNEKHLIPLDEKRKLLGRFALYLWHQGVTTLYVSDLDNWLLENLNDYPQLSIKVNTGMYEPEVILQDLHNASLLVRDNDDEYRFAHTSFFEFFVAVGIFDSVINTTDTTLGFEPIFTRSNLSNEIIQFLVDWRLASRARDKLKFDKQWQLLQQAEGSVESRQVAFNVWYFGYYKNQEFTRLDKPNWQGLSLSNLELDKPLDNTMLDLSDVNLADAKVEACDFSSINFVNAKLTNTYFRQNKFDNCNLNDWTEDTAWFNGNRFNDCIIPNSWEAGDLQASNLIISSVNNEVLQDQDSDVLQQLIQETTGGKVICYHPDGKRVILGDGDKASLWHITDDNIICLQKLTVEHAINSCEFNFDGTYLVMAGRGGASLWNVTDKKIILLDKFINQFLVESCQFHPNSNFLISLLANGEASLWQISDSKITLVQKFHDEPFVRSCQFNYKGTQLLLAGHSGASLWSISNTKVSFLYRFAEDITIKNCKISPDGSQVVLLEEHEGASIWSINSRNANFLQSFAEGETITDCQFNPNGSQLAVSGVSYIGIWNISDKNLTLMYEFEDVLFVRYCQFSSDGEFLITGELEKVNIWKITNTSINTFYKLPNFYNSYICKFNPCNNNQLLIGSNEGVSVWSFVANNMVCLYNLPKKRIFKNCKFNCEKSQIAYLNNNSIIFWNITSKKIHFMQELTEEFYIQSFKFSPDGTQLAVVGLRGLSLWNVNNSFNCLYRSTDVTYAENCQFSPDGTYLVAFGHTGAGLWNINNKSCTFLQDLGKGSGVESCQFSPNGSKLVIVGYEGTRLWSVVNEDITLLYEFSGINYSKDCQFSPDGSKLVIVGHRGASIWSIADKDIRLSHEFIDIGLSSHCQFSPDGSKLFTLSHGGANLWNVTNKNFPLLHEFDDVGEVESCQFTTDSTQLILIGNSGASLWDISDDNNITCLQRFAENLTLSDIDLNPDNDLIAMTGFDRTYLYSLEDKQVIEVAVLQNFDDASIQYTDTSFTHVSTIQGEAWKYLYNKVTHPDGTIQILAPDTHPDWERAYIDVS